MSYGACTDRDIGECQGEVLEETSTTGATSSFRCRKHRDEYLDRMDKVHRDVSSRYPGYDIPGSPPPPDFDPTYAGERWEEDY